MFPPGDRGSKQCVHSWIRADGGYELTRSAVNIQCIIAELSERHITLSLHQTGINAESTPRALDEAGLVIERPTAWPESRQWIRVDFRAVDGLRHYFYSSAQILTDDSLLLVRPSEVFRLQLRSHPRFAPPSGSSVAFLHGKAHYKGLLLKDISVGGMHFVSGELLPLGRFALVSRIVITLPSSSTSRQLIVNSGTIMHVARDDRTRVYGYGLKFCLDAGIQETLAQVFSLPRA